MRSAYCCRIVGDGTNRAQVRHQASRREETRATAHRTLVLAGRDFLTLAQAQIAEGPASLAAEIAGKTWLFTLGGQGGATPGGIKVAKIGPVPEIRAPEYLLRINNAGGPRGPRRGCPIITWRNLIVQWR